MAEKDDRRASIKLSTVDDLFSTDESRADAQREKVMEIPLAELVRPKPDGSYEMVSGHRRKKASELAGAETKPCIVRELDDDQATIILVDSNLQRENISASEKAFVYKMKLDAIKRQGARNDLTSAQLAQKSAGIPDVMAYDTAFFDRMHYYLPGWEIPKMRPEYFTNEYGFITDYLAEFFREMRKRSFGDWKGS